MKNTFELEHVGINTDNAGEAEQLALLLCKLFNLEPRHGQKSEFAGNYFECMKSPFHNFGNAAAYSTVLTLTSIISLLIFFKLTHNKDISV